MAELGKRVVIYFLVSLVLANFAFADHVAAIKNVGYTPIYETTNTSIVLNVANDLTSANSIRNVSIAYTGFDILSVITPVDWGSIIDNPLVYYGVASAISNWGSQNFGFDVSALNVDEDTIYTWPIKTIDSNGDIQTNNIELMVLNDDTPPIINYIIPADGSYIYGALQQFAVNAIDPETGVKDANLHLSNCDLVLDPLTNTSSMQYEEIALNCENDLCAQDYDLNSWDEGDICYYFDISNNGGEVATVTAKSIIDRTAPTVTLTAPENNFQTNSNDVDFSFIANDNFAPQMSCVIAINDNLNNITAENGVETIQTINLNDGRYDWNVTCSDLVPLNASSETRSLLVDTRAPNITITEIGVVNRGDLVTVDYVVTDEGVGVDSSSIVVEIVDPNGNVTFGDSLQTTLDSPLGIYTVIISASDLLGHVATEQIQFRLRFNYVITLSISPNPAQPSNLSENITNYADINGNVVMDNGSMIAENEINLNLINENVTVSIDSSGNFAYQIDVPEQAGSYPITAEIVSVLDTYSKTENLIVVGPYCGDNIVNNDEECDGSISQTCADYGFDQGTLRCSASCTIDTSGCSNTPRQRSSRGGSGNPVMITNIVEEQNESGDSGIVASFCGDGICQENEKDDCHADCEIAECYIDDDCAEGLECLSEKCVQKQTGQSLNATIENRKRGFGIGKAWALFMDSIGPINWNMLLGLMVVAALLYFFGWRKNKKDEMTVYIEKRR